MDEFANDPREEATGMRTHGALIVPLSFSAAFVLHDVITRLRAERAAKPEHAAESLVLTYLRGRLAEGLRERGIDDVVQAAAEATPAVRASAEDGGGTKTRAVECAGGVHLEFQASDAAVFAARCEREPGVVPAEAVAAAEEHVLTDLTSTLESIVLPDPEAGIHEGLRSQARAEVLAGDLAGRESTSRPAGALTVVERPASEPEQRSPGGALGCLLLYPLSYLLMFLGLWAWRGFGWFLAVLGGFGAVLLVAILRRIRETVREHRRDLRHGLVTDITARPRAVYALDLLEALYLDCGEAAVYLQDVGLARGILYGGPGGDGRYHRQNVPSEFAITCMSGSGRLLGVVPRGAGLHLERDLCDGSEQRVRYRECAVLHGVDPDDPEGSWRRARAQAARS